GLPKELGGPLAFLLGGSLLPEEERMRREIEDARRALLRRGDERIETWSTSTDAGPDRPDPSLPDVISRSVSLRHVAAIGSILPYWGTFLLLCARSIQARTVL